MGSNSLAFVKSRRNSITQKRIKQILSYVMECHNLFLQDGITYSKSSITASGTVMFEDHLKFEFVEKYLVKNKLLLKSKISELEEINFLCETQKRYIDFIDGKIKPDKIDVFINKLGLQKTWENESDENVYLALECKRILIKSDAKDYVLDIEKFVNRSHVDLRLPFEGQIAFIENSKLNHKIISDEVNSILKLSSSIETDLFLLSEKLHSTLNCTYLSKHKRNHNKQSFSIYHLMFDYSKVVLN
ncbi:MAG: hypothetical protein H7239_01515 [Flavobacterium sp.]|nr:hypothetical protein [Flavobacterium sp.]